MLRGFLSSCSFWAVCLTLIFSASGALAIDYTCGETVENRFHTTQTICSESGVLLRIERYFKSTGTISLINHYTDDKLVLRQSYNTGEELVQEFGFEYPDALTHYRIFYQLGAVPRIETGRQRYTGLPEDEEKIHLEDWVYEKRDDGSYKLEVVDHFKNKLIVKREIFNDESRKEETYIYKHPEVPNVFRHVESFKAYDKQGNLIKEYSPMQTIDVRSYVTLPEQIRVLEDSGRRKIVVMDTGFDVSHPELAYKFHLNLEDPIDGVDNDNNGVVDDLIGWNVTDDGDFTNNINEQVSVKSKSKPYKPFSHGTHVASLALNGIEEFSLTAFSGNMADVNHLNMIESVVDERRIEFVNMSFSIGDPKDPLAPGRESFRALESLIRNNRETVFVVAAGNGGQDLDNAGFGRREFPASYKYKNILTVGALDSASLEEFRMPFYKPVFFSARGNKTVDVFAPGHMVRGAAVGGGQIEVSGTSMATPNALNLILKLAVKYPNLSPSILREVILYSAYVPDINLPLECSSGGMIFPRRAFEVARRVFESGARVKETALEVRADEQFLLPGELLDQNQIQALQNLWEDRGL